MSISTNLVTGGVCTRPLLLSGVCVLSLNAFIEDPLTLGKNIANGLHLSSLVFPHSWSRVGHCATSGHKCLFMTTQADTAQVNGF
jgi:hypothetical protein